MKKTQTATKIFELMKKQQCRQITFHFNPKTNLQLVCVIDSIPEERDSKERLANRVSVSGGTRFAHCNPDNALDDALKLARAMTRKAKVLQVNEGGCKIVVLANQKKSKKFLHSIGDFVELHKGLIKTAVDLGFNLKDGEEIASRSRYIDSLSHLKKGLGSTGENTTQGIINGFEIVCDKILNKSLSNCSVAIQGLGAVGFSLAEKLLLKGCFVYGADLNKKQCQKAKAISVKIISSNKILFQKVDILAPCAIGAVIHKDNISRLNCKVIAGGANNPLSNEFSVEKKLLQKGIVYVPDFVLNCGGFLQALIERKGGSVSEAREKSKIIAKKLKKIIQHSIQHKKTLLESAIALFDLQKH